MVISQTGHLPTIQLKPSVYKHGNSNESGLIRRSDDKYDCKCCWSPGWVCRLCVVDRRVLASVSAVSSRIRGVRYIDKTYWKAEISTILRNKYCINQNLAYRTPVISAWLLIASHLNVIMGCDRCWARVVAISYHTPPLSSSIWSPIW